MKQGQPTPETVEAIMHLAADMSQAMNKAMRAHPEIDWMDAVSAAAVACRAAAATEMANRPGLDLDTARAMMLKTFINVLALPPELIRIVKNDEHGDDETIVIPVRRH